MPKPCFQLQKYHIIKSPILKKHKVKKYMYEKCQQDDDFVMKHICSLEMYRYETVLYNDFLFLLRGYAYSYI